MMKLKPQLAGRCVMPKQALIVSLLITVLAMSASACASDDGAPAEGDDAAPAEGSDVAPDGDANAFEPGTVTVSISGFGEAAGSYLAGVLNQGEPALLNAVGGFGVEVDSDSFATSQVVREPQPRPDYDNTLFPYVSEEPLVVESGSYYLQLWFAASEMGPYSRWVPGLTEGLRGCQMQFSIDAGSAVHVSVTDMPSGGTEVSLTCPAVSWETIS